MDNIKKLNQFLKNKAFGWALYVLITVFLITYIIYLISTKEISEITYNKIDIHSRTYVLIFNINEFDYSKQKINCDLNIYTDFGHTFKIASLIIGSKSDTLIRNDVFPTCFSYPPLTDMINIAEEKEVRLPYQELNGRTFDFSFRPNNGNKFLYPFDKYYVQLETLIIGNETPLPNFEIRVRDNISDLNMINFHKKSDLSFSFQFVRSKFIRFFTIFIYTIAFITLIFIGVKQNIKDILFQSLGYFLALWGIRDIMSKNVSFFPTLIDYLTIILITLLILIISGRLLNQFYKSKVTPLPHKNP